ncbi:S1C family serine protease [Frondihabitans cladoniiphilus]|uniref:Trypsin-like peptidase domain-containing protein n=1 Tax=Frondihabitans cladoniiphilus TaxID=715785 RepID=A0ABP8VU26_9MICO
MNETPEPNGTPDDHEDALADRSRRGDDSVPAAEAPVASGPTAPPLPGTTPEPLSAMRQADLPAPTGAHRAPASLDHAAYAGSHSAAYADLSAQAANDPVVGANADYLGGANGAASAYGSTGVEAGAPAAKTRGRGIGAFVGVAVVAAIIGGLVATGGYALLGSRSTSETGTSTSLTVNDYKDATIVTAVAAKATPSVVTINVVSGSSAGTGSGVILSSDGYIVTNTHVVTLDGASATGTIAVTLANGHIYTGKVVGLDPLVDLAVVKISATGLQPITFGDSSKINVGATAVAIGAPLGLSNTVTDGIISTLNRSITVASSAVPDSSSTAGGSTGGSSNNGQGPFSFDNGTGSTSTAATNISLPVVQTDASINPGNSGGALLDSKGHLIGINVAIASAPSSSSSGGSAGSIGVGFAVPSNLVDRVAKSIMASGSATHGLLGASIDDATSDSSATQTGALIKSLVSGGAAEKAGLRAGDVVTKVDGNGVTDATDLTAQIRTLAGGATAQVTFIRDGSTKTADVVLGTLKG